MSVAPYQKLKNVQRILYITLGLLLLATVASLLNSLLNYLVVALLAAAIFAFHWFTRDNTRMAVWRKYLAMAVPVITILAPLIYVILVLFVFNDAAKWLHFARFCTIILPLVLLMYAIRSLQKLIDQL